MNARGGKPDASRADARPAFGRLVNVTKTFDTGSQLVSAVQDVSLQFRKGDLVSLLGPSGCGKTTVLKMMGGLIPATSGLLELDGKAITAPYPGVGVVFQAPTLMPWRSVLANVLFPMEVVGRNDRRAKERAREILNLVGLSGFEQAYPRQLSGGMQQRVALCRAIIHEPSILLMDEPFGALDELTRLEMNDLLLDIRRVTGATVVFVTHSISEAIYLSDKVYVFSKRPAVIVLELDIDIAYPRSSQTRFLEQFTALEKRAGIALGVVK
ncbi:MAG: ABC transporter ATP-binding protein [Hyphomicrobiales bacterium]|nr:ABC transporter ATP-binding protein [Hyphomicrobiales bacterium]